jgi:hypothetical protein
VSMKEPGMMPATYNEGWWHFNSTKERIYTA